MITAIFRKGGDIAFISKELSQIQSFQDGTFMEGLYYGSLPAYLGAIIARHLGGLENGQVLEIPSITLPSPPQQIQTAPTGGICPECSAPTLIRVEGCDKCLSCGYSHCG